MYMFMSVTTCVKETSINLSQIGVHIAIFGWQFQQYGILQHHLTPEKNAQNISQQ